MTMLTLEMTVDSSRVPKDNVEDCLRAYLTFLNEERALKCKPPVGKHFMTNMFPYIGRMLSDDIPYMAHIQNYMAGKQKSTIATYIVAMKQFFAWAVVTGRLAVNPVERMRIPVIEKKPRRTLTLEDIKKIFAIEMTMEQKIIFQLLVETGCRRCEIPCITLDDLPKSNEAQVITIHGKGGKPRVCTISANTIDLIRKSFATKPRKYLFQDLKGRPINTVIIHRLFTDVMTIAGVKTPQDAMHMFRRTFITDLHRKGVPLATIQTLAGHANMNTTFGYIHVNLSDIEKVYELEIFQMLTKIYEGKATIPD